MSTTSNATDVQMRGSQLYTALFFPSLEFFPTGFSLARFLMRQYSISSTKGIRSFQKLPDLTNKESAKTELKVQNLLLAARIPIMRFFKYPILRGLVKSVLFGKTEFDKKKYSARPAQQRP
ncbi:hypothetical protein LXL04_009715 [Taraxacum kok-saghyz]